ncbi:hypothetical protein SAMN06296036_113160 [Pseudobacteriovorax antillogorgiicola]|uniref:Uncharacterized protein n=1 Tax=Pseudobacteriovorax antillogorgiicola TaxID=1513793 RepID=A0A1Y6CBZ8_9BACT|nr:hypothetical protein EDD56_114155 [Pseudobacteriovorax antillogorgiicola]SMF44878.1 hypothetical protein SAMN06296036_113160 [Pseudobacteriovorax antillogorgiicola]
MTQNGDGSTTFSTIDFGYYGIAIPDRVELEILANGISLDRIDITANFEEKLFRGVILRSFYYEAVDFFNYGDAIGFRVHVSRVEERQTYPKVDWYEASVLFGTCL